MISKFLEKRQVAQFLDQLVLVPYDYAWLPILLFIVLFKPVILSYINQS